MPRNIRSLSAALTALFCVYGCAQATRVWVKDGADEQALQSAQYECLRDLHQSGGFGTGIVGSINQDIFFVRCMQAHGWSLQSAEPDDEEGTREAQARVKAAESCEAKGLHPGDHDYYVCFQKSLSASLSPPH